jgi:hypothetical protein
MALQMGGNHKLQFLLFQKISQKFRPIPHTPSEFVPPSFPEFVDFVVSENLEGRTLDNHWSPVHRLCTPCMFPLTHIVKFETFARDQVLILRPLHLQQQRWRCSRLKRFYEV